LNLPGCATRRPSCLTVESCRDASANRTVRFSPGRDDSVRPQRPHRSQAAARRAGMKLVSNVTPASSRMAMAIEAGSPGWMP